MLRTNHWSYFEGFSETEEGKTVMNFYAQVNKTDPTNVMIAEKETEEDSYRKNIQLIRKDRREFEDLVYAEADRITQQLFPPQEEVEEVNCPQLSENIENLEGGVSDEI